MKRSKKHGYSGTAVFLSEDFPGGKPDKISFDFHKQGYHDDEGRVLTLHFKSFLLVAMYTPNSGVPVLDRLDYRVDEWDKAF